MLDVLGKSNHKPYLHAIHRKLGYSKLPRILNKLLNSSGHILGPFFASLLIISRHILTLEEAFYTSGLFVYERGTGLLESL